MESANAINYGKEIIAKEGLALTNAVTMESV